MMEFLDKLVLPHSGANLELLKYLLFLAQLIFLLFSGALLGSSVLSFATGIIANRKKNDEYARLSVDYMDLILTSKMMGIGLGLLPLLSILLIYLQLLHNSGSAFIEELIYSTVLYIIGYLLLSVYRIRLHSKKAKKRSENVTGETKAGLNIKPFLALPGIMLIFISLRLIISINTFTADVSKWQEAGNLSSLIFSFPAIFAFIGFLTVSFALSAIAFLVKTFYWDNAENLSEDYTILASKINTRVALIFSLLLPALYVINSLLIPESTVSSLPFGLILIALILTFILVHLLYENLKSGATHYSTFSFYLIIAIFAVFVAKEQISFGVASREQLLILSHNYELEEAALLEKSGQSVSSVNGGEIYQSKCMACHKFEERLIGPPHKDVMIKYKGREDDMVKFILNPVKVDPAYPPMPSQGLTPKEAKAVVEYMYKHFADKIK